jgi:hypothetical protein
MASLIVLRVADIEFLNNFEHFDYTEALIFVVVELSKNFPHSHYW